MSDTSDIQYRITILGGALQGIGLSLAVHYGHDSKQVMDAHGEALGNAIESLGYYAQHLADRLEDAEA